MSDMKINTAKYVYPTGVSPTVGLINALPIELTMENLSYKKTKSSIIY